MFCIWEACKEMELLGPKLLSYQLVCVCYGVPGYSVSRNRGRSIPLIVSSSEFPIGTVNTMKNKAFTWQVNYRILFILLA